MRSWFLIPLLLSLPACQPPSMPCEDAGGAWYFYRHDIFREQGVVRMHAIYVCRTAPTHP